MTTPGFLSLESRVLRSSRAWAVAGCLLSVLIAGCGNPATPSPPTGPPPPPPPPVNTSPVIRAITAARATLEVNESVQLSAVVEDLESTSDKLVFTWSSPTGGSFVGQGALVEWRPPLNAPTPASPVLTLTVVESYEGLDNLGKIATLEHRVSSSVTVRLHNSPKELGDMGTSFLEKFATSSISPQACVVDFSTRCAGRQAELQDIAQNRELFVVLSRELGVPRITSLTRYVRADVRISCSFVSRRLKCPPGEAGCVVGALDRAAGDCRMTAVYEQARWWLCESRFSGNSLLPPALKLFFGSDALD